MKIVISGLGVMGASLALAIKNSHIKADIYGYDFNPVIDNALNLQIIDYKIKKWPDECSDADIVFLATPIFVIKEHLQGLNGCIGKDTIVSDLGSTKTAIYNYAKEMNFSGSYIGGHPMTGAEKSGIGSANPLMYENAIYILTGEKEEAIKSKKNKLVELLTIIKARVFYLDIHKHDEIMALISHLPQMLAVALMNYVGQKNEELQHCFELAAGGFRDLTRIASSSSDIWQDIVDSNKVNIENAIEKFIKHLELEKSNLHNLSTFFSKANAYRSEIPKQSKGFLSPLTNVLVYVNDQMGVIAKVSNALFSKGIDIRDIELLKIRENEGGVFMISFENRKKAADAVEILKSINYMAYIKE